MVTNPQKGDKIWRVLYNPDHGAWAEQCTVKEIKIFRTLFRRIAKFIRSKITKI